MKTRLTVESLLTKGIDKEIGAQRLYQDLSQKMTAAAASDAFSQLSHEEKHCEEMLRKYRCGKILVWGLKKTEYWAIKLLTTLTSPRQ